MALLKCKTHNSLTQFCSIGPTDLTEGTLTTEKLSLISTVPDNLFGQGTIQANVMGVYFQPLNSSTGANNDGSIAFGGADPTKFTHPVSYTPITSVAPVSDFWGIDQTVTCGFRNSVKWFSSLSNWTH